MHTGDIAIDHNVLNCSRYIHVHILYIYIYICTSNIADVKKFKYFNNINI